MKLLIDSDQDCLSYSQIQTAYALGEMGFHRFYIVDRGELTAQRKLNISGIRTIVSWSERADTRVYVNDIDHCIWSSENDFRDEEGNWFDIFEQVSDIEVFARQIVGEWTRKEFTETTDD